MNWSIQQCSADHVCTADEKHIDEHLILYCKDCQLVICVSCHALDHTAHLCCGLQESSTEIKEQLEKCSTTLNSCVEFYNEVKKQLDWDKDDIMTQIRAADTSIAEGEGELN